MKKGELIGIFIPVFIKINWTEAF